MGDFDGEYSTVSGITRVPAKILVDYNWIIHQLLDRLPEDPEWGEVKMCLRNLDDAQRRD